MVVPILEYGNDASDCDIGAEEELKQCADEESEGSVYNHHSKKARYS